MGAMLLPLVPSDMVPVLRVGAGAAVPDVRALWVRVCLAVDTVVVLERRRPVVDVADSAGTRRREETVPASAEDFEAAGATDRGLAPADDAVPSLIMDIGLPAAILDFPASGAGLPIPILLEPGNLIDVVRAMPDLGAAATAEVDLGAPNNAA